MQQLKKQYILKPFLCFHNSTNEMQQNCFMVDCVTAYF